MPRFDARGKLARWSSAGLLVACGAREPAVQPGVGSAAPSPSGLAPAPGPWAPSSAPRSTPTLLITEPAVLAALERAGLGLGQVLSSADARNNAELSELASFAPVVRVLEGELREAAAGDKLAGVEVARFSHRLFDRRFLRSTHASFVLAGVVNRPDRVPFVEASCGETRLIYRLSYQHDAERASKLPMTIGIELRVPRPEGGCRAAAERWLEPASASAAERAEWLRSQGPLSPALITKEMRVTVNAQLVRWPSTVRPDLGGHAEYSLHAFRLNDVGGLTPEPLENTLAPGAVARPEASAELLHWLGEHATEVDSGTALLPQRFLASSAISVTPRGLNRLANRPFSAALGQASFDAATRGPFIKSKAGWLRRLDQLSCQGCHEARSVAGFHLLGEDGPETPHENALATPVSPHVTADLSRRLRIAQSMLAGEEPDFSAPLAERPSASGEYGAHCSLTNDPSFESWKCDEGLACSATEAAHGEPIGQCLPVVRQVGDACETGAVVAHPDRRRDRMQSLKVEECPGMVCNRSAVGFPAGMCTARCGAPGSSCGAIAILDSFNACLARGDSFLTCIRNNATPSGLRPCSSESPCRDDYVCARSAEGGVCIPPYFVFQLRVDGH